MPIPFARRPPTEAASRDPEKGRLHWRHRIAAALAAVSTALPRSLFPARFVRSPNEPEDGAAPDGRTFDGRVADQLACARRAALLGIRRMPLAPGLWVRTTLDGRQELYRIKDQNGELYATVGFMPAMAVPARCLPGHWDRLG